MEVEDGDPLRFDRDKVVGVEDAVGVGIMLAVVGAEVGVVIK